MATWHARTTDETFALLLADARAMPKEPEKVKPISTSRIGRPPLAEPYEVQVNFTITRRQADRLARWVGGRDRADVIREALRAKIGGRK